MKIVRAHLLLSIAAFAGASASSASAPLKSQYTELAGCSIVDHITDEHEDWVLHRCYGLGVVPVWLAYSDGNKSYVGFGRTRNVTGWFGIDRDDKWAIEWRGRLQGNQFIPFAVIIRMPELPAGSGNDLVVYRLRPDGASCIIGLTKSTNGAARKIADASAIKYTCIQEPQVVE